MRKRKKKKGDSRAGQVSRDKKRRMKLGCRCTRLKRRCVGHGKSLWN